MGGNNSSNVVMYNVGTYKWRNFPFNSLHQNVLSVDKAHKVTCDMCLYVCGMVPNCRPTVVVVHRCVHKTCTNFHHTTNHPRCIIFSVHIILCTYVEQTDPNWQLCLYVASCIQHTTFLGQQNIMEGLLQHQNISLHSSPSFTPLLNL